MTNDKRRFTRAQADAAGKIVQMNLSARDERDAANERARVLYEALNEIIGVECNGERTPRLDANLNIILDWIVIPDEINAAIAALERYEKETLK